MLNTLDIILLLPIVYGLIRGIFRGLIGELTAILAVVVAVICAKLFAPQVALRLIQHIELSEQICEITAYLLVFFGVALLLTLMGKGISRLLKAISLGWLNRLLGAVFGAAKWALLMSVLLNGAILFDEMFHFIKPEMKEQSVVYEPMRKIASVAWDEVRKINISDESVSLVRQ